MYKEGHLLNILDTVNVINVNSFHGLVFVVVFLVICLNSVTVGMM